MKATAIPALGPQPDRSRSATREPPEGTRTPRARTRAAGRLAPGGPKALPDYLAPSLELVLVGINPGLRSAMLGHHFAGVGNKFWKLLFESRLVPRPLTYEEDFRLLEHGIGLTNIVARPSRSSSDLRPEDFERGRKSLRRKLERYRPRAVALVGVTVLRELWPEISTVPLPRAIRCGRVPETLGSATLFVVPNPSGRNAHFTYAEMLAEWRCIARFLSRSRDA